jgi:hypothetical protein
VQLTAAATVLLAVWNLRRSIAYQRKNAEMGNESVYIPSQAAHWLCGPSYER